MVDPVDGTTNFVHRFPFSCVSIGLAVNKQPVVGVVFNPIMGELYQAVRGGGAFRNGEPISVSDTAELGRAVVGTELGTRRDAAFLEACFDRMRALGRATRSMRCSGSCALNLCSVAMGRCVQRLLLLLLPLGPRSCESPAWLHGVLAGAAGGPCLVAWWCWWRRARASRSPVPCVLPGPGAGKARAPEKPTFCTLALPRAGLIFIMSLALAGAGTSAQQCWCWRRQAAGCWIPLAGHLIL